MAFARPVVDTSISRAIRADPREIFNLAADVQDWPRILPHYRWVHVLATDSGNRRTVEMAARRDVVPGVIAFPLRWTAVETTYPDQGRIEFEHIGGMTRGMRVAWTIESTPEESGVLVRIRHVFEPTWPVPSALVRLIVGEYFVNGVARRTLRRIADLAESSPTLQRL
jgi:ribosome-associated toxin RatA of RatAB toxin-antitoxin module